jgi:hypothetical protein
MLRFVSTIESAGFAGAQKEKRKSRRKINE